MANLGERSKRDDQKQREFKPRVHGRTLYKDKKAGDQIVISAVLDKWYHVQQMTYPAVYENDKGDPQESVSFVRLNGKYWNHNAKGKPEMDKDFIKGGNDSRPQAEANLVTLANYTLEQYRLFAIKMYVQQGKSEEEAKKMAVEKIALALGSGEQTRKFYNKAGEEFGTLAIINGEPVPIPVKAVTYDPVTNVRSDAGYWRESLKPDTKVAVLLDAEFTPKGFADESGNMTTNEKLAALFEFNRGIKQFSEEIISDKDGNKFFRYPPFITEFILSAQDSKKPFGKKHFTVWRPTANLHDDYQFYLPAEYENPLPIHPEDADIVRAYLALPSAKQAVTPPPKYRSYPSDDGLLVYVSMDNPSLPPTPAINVFEGSLGERFTPELLDKIKEYGEYHGFRPNTQEGLLGGYFYDYPEYEYEITAQIMGETLKAKGKTGADRIYVAPGLDFELKDGKPVIEIDGHETTLEWTPGLLNSKPVHIDSSYLMRILMEKGLIRTNNVSAIAGEIDKVTELLKKKADELGIPYVGGKTAEPYEHYKSSPHYAALVAYHESKFKKKADSGSDSDDEVVPQNAERGQDVGL